MQPVTPCLQVHSIDGERERERERQREKERGSEREKEKKIERERKRERGKERERDCVCVCVCVCARERETTHFTQRPATDLRKMCDATPSSSRSLPLTLPLNLQFIVA